MRVDRLDERIREHFPLELARSVFLNLGSPEYDSTQPIRVAPANFFGFSRSALRRPPATASSLDGKAAVADCTCSHGSDWCSAGMSCSAASCALTEWGCGTLWMSPCTGDCKLDM